MTSTAPARTPDRKAIEMPRTSTRAVAPWVRTRLRTAPGAAGAFALLVLVTAFLAAALPRAVDSYETEGLRHAIRTAPPRTTVLDITTGPPASDLPPASRS